MDSNSLPLLKGTLDLLILKTLSWGARHGFAIARWLEERADGEMEIEDSALYQALHRLEEREFVTAEWGLTENNRKARYYRLTTAGRGRLRADADVWKRYAKVVGRILATTPRTA
ncbi:MAG: PadR family transcriptional regulator [Gemmatimonadaceae bacterium]